MGEKEHDVCEGFRVFAQPMLTFQMAEVAVSKEVWAEMLSRIDRLRWMTA